ESDPSDRPKPKPGKVFQSFQRANMTSLLCEGRNFARAPTILAVGRALHFLRLFGPFPGFQAATALNLAIVGGRARGRGRFLRQLCVPLAADATRAGGSDAHADRCGPLALSRACRGATAAARRERRTRDNRALPRAQFRARARGSPEL